MDDVILGQVAPIVGQRYGVAERHLSQLIHMNQNVLGEGCFGKVVAVTVEGCYPLSNRNKGDPEPKLRPRTSATLDALSE